MILLLEQHLISVSLPLIVHYIKRGSNCYIKIGDFVTHVWSVTIKHCHCSDTV